MYGMGGYSGSSGYSSSGYSHSSGYSSAAGYSGGAGYSTGHSAPASQYSQPDTPHFSFADSFLAENRPMTPMISDMGEVKEVIEQTFEKITGQEFPHDSIKIMICDEQKFRQVHNNTGGS